MIKQILHRVNKDFGITFFKNPNNLYYNIFNHYLRKNIVSVTTEMENFHKEGFFKNNFNISSELDGLCDLMNSQNPQRNEKNIFLYTLNHEIRSEVKKILINNFSPIIEEFKKYFRQNISVIDVQIKRNYSLENIELQNKSKQVEFFNNFFHCDHYIGTYFKLFINLHDVGNEHGPLEAFSIENTKRFVKETHYKSRHQYADSKLDYMFKNTGKKGDSLFCSTPLCLHRASVPEKGLFRDMLFITFAASNKNQTNDLFGFEKDFEKSIWSHENTLRNKLCKPAGARKTFKVFKNIKINN